QDLNRLDDGTPVETTYTPKYFGSGQSNCGDITVQNAGKQGRDFCGPTQTGIAVVPAPWRSLIYRNVDTPYTYFDDYVPFPHMPMNTPGFDCRVPQIMGNWMVGLPARRKSPYFSEDFLPRKADHDGEITYERNPQPYEEVRPGDADYKTATDAASARLDEYHKGVRYDYCQDVLSLDIYDPVKLSSNGYYHPDPVAYQLPGFP